MVLFTWSFGDQAAPEGLGVLATTIIPPLLLPRAALLYTAPASSRPSLHILRDPSVISELGAE